jgi:hypothetical protein
MNIKIYLLSVILLITLSSCRFYGVRGSGDVVKEKRDIEEFTSLEVGGIFDVEIICGKEESLVIEAEDNLIPLIETEVKGNRLIISTKRHISPRNGLKIKIKAREVNNIDISGACKVKVTEINSDKFFVGASGASNVYLSGKAKKLNIDVSGASNINASDLNTEIVKADLSGASKADIFVTQDLFADISGASHIDYYGDPKNIKYDCSGASSLNRK